MNKKDRDTSISLHPLEFDEAIEMLVFGGRQTGWRDYIPAFVRRQ